SAANAVRIQSTATRIKPSLLGASPVSVGSKSRLRILSIRDIFPRMWRLFTTLENPAEGFISLQAFYVAAMVRATHRLKAISHQYCRPPVLCFSGQPLADRRKPATYSSHTRPAQLCRPRPPWRQEVFHLSPHYGR